MSLSDEEGHQESWGWTDLSSYSPSLLDSEREQQIIPTVRPPIMSRRSLRLHTSGSSYREDSLQDYSLPYSSTSFSTGASTRRDARSLKSQQSQQHSLSCSQSLLYQTPQKRASQLMQNSSLHSVASDASLLSSMLDESSIQDRTLVVSGGLWGLDEDSDALESTIIPERGNRQGNSTLLADRDNHCPKHPAQTQTSMIKGCYYCEECVLHSDGKDALTTHYPSSKNVAPSVRANGPVHTQAPDQGLVASEASSPPSTIYGRNKGHKGKTGHQSTYRGTMKVKASETNEKHLDLNRSLSLRSLITSCPCSSLSGLVSWWGPADLLPDLLAVNVTEWSTALPVTSLPGLSSIYIFTSSGRRAEEKSGDMKAHIAPPPVPLSEEVTPEGDAMSGGSARLLQLEQRLSLLWKKMEGDGHKAEQRHKEVVQLYQGLQQQLHSQTSRESMEHWVVGLLEERLGELQLHLQEERLEREETQKQYVVQQQSQESHLAELEPLLQSMAAKIEKIQQRQEALKAVGPVPQIPPTPVSMAVDNESHDALVAEVSRLEAALGTIRDELQGLMGCQDSWERLDQIEEKMSAQVREELRALLYGNQLTTFPEALADAAALPVSFLEWLSERYVNRADLQVSLTSLELSILQNISLQLEQQSTKETHYSATVKETALHTMGAAGGAVTEEQVQLIVRNALRLYSQDRTGLPDYALESGGGSILSTRCSETYETKSALLSLFGLPLWYFSQSPRVVIQPEVHPGNCWAFKGASGYLVIRLSMKILPTAFSLEHIPKALAPSRTLRSAPRDFNVYGLDDEHQEKGKLLGSYTYEEEGEALQTYPVKANDRAYQIIEVQVLSNWGHKEYTCMYRLRVHGEPSDH
ncbi:SUN domain-containing protein 1 [Lampris incognitus]|uniref:SUN domain-containing protein 1 n=1 Tax=Lampris incognitus TaxID=2546036 RepID=UPI0024B4B75B|nr:SUN domain-containing protein 1 [Lampris incognitus]